MIYPQSTATDCHQKCGLFRPGLSSGSLGKAPWPGKTMLWPKQTVGYFVNAGQQPCSVITYGVCPGYRVWTLVGSSYRSHIPTYQRKQSQLCSLSVPLRKHSCQTPSNFLVLLLRCTILPCLLPGGSLSV